MGHIKDDLIPVDRVEVTTLIDNYADALLENTEIVERAPHHEGEVIPEDTLLAEHGLCLMVTVHAGGGKKTVLFDAGYSKVGVLHNLEMLQLDLGEVESLVVSHRHMDHTAGIYTLLDKIGRPIELIVHPEALVFERYLRLKDGRTIRFPKILDREKLAGRDVKLRESEGPLLIAGGAIAVTGQVERTTPFEKGMTNALVEKEGRMEQDPVADDQALALHLKGKGLVVISGCSHSGIVNTVEYAGKITGVETLYGVLGGFHLTGPAYEPIVGDTISALREMAPEVVVPMHCTGWNAIKQFSEAFPGSFILNSVGSKFILT